MNALPLILTVFVACAVEAVEALHHEAPAYLREVAEARDAGGHVPARVRARWYAFTLAFKGCLARRARGGVHRAHLRRQPEEHPRGGWLLPITVVAALGWSVHRATARKSLASAGDQRPAHLERRE